MDLRVFHKGDCHIPFKKLDSRTEERVLRIVDLSRRRDRILEAPVLDLEGLAILAADYEAANMPCAAADLRRRLNYYRERGMIKVLNIKRSEERQDYRQTSAAM